ncbi:hypothetical protein ACFLUV_05685 [Elusimicrobiota bacterium]
MKQIFSIMLRAGKLDPSVFEEVRIRPEAMSQAVAVIIIASIAAGFGSMGSVGIQGIFTGTLRAMVSWLIWAYTAYIISSRIMPGSKKWSGFTELLRTMGISTAPGVIRVIGIITPLYGLIYFAANIWMIACMTVAMKQTQEYPTVWKAAEICIFSWLVSFVLTGLIRAI